MLPTIDDYPERYRYRYCPLDGTPLERQVVHGVERLRCPVDGWTLYPNPNIAATVLIEHAGGIVLAQRANDPDKGIWHLPIGHVEFGEDPADAAVREVHEETGLEIAGLRLLIYEHSPSYGDPRMYYLVFGFVAQAVGGVLQVNDAENSAVQVVPLDAMPALKWTSQAKLLAAYRREQGA